MNLPVTAAMIYTLMVTGVVVFQCCLIAGAPWGHLTQGGQRQGQLSMSGRIVAFLSIPLLLFMGAGITSAAGLWPDWATWTGWTALAVQAVVTCLNWITRSRSERQLWGPITSVMAGLAAYVLASEPV